MRRSTLFLISLFVVMFLGSSCTKEPTAGFKMSKTVAYINEEIQFTNESVDAYSYEWDFGDGNTSTEENPTHSYKVGGTYKVTLTAYSKNGKKTNTYTQSIEIKNRITLKNNTFTTVHYTINGQEKELASGATVTENDVPNPVVISAYTYEKDPDFNNQLGEKIQWQTSIDVKNGTDYAFNVSKEYFYLAIENCTSEWINYVCINLDMGEDEKEYDIDIPNDCDAFPMGYYKNLGEDSDVYVEFDDGSDSYFDDFHFTNEDNQGFTVTFYGGKVELNPIHNSEEENFINLYPTDNQAL